MSAESAGLGGRRTAEFSRTSNVANAIDSNELNPAVGTAEASQPLWVATEKGRTESDAGTLALSIRQRKLLSLLLTPQTASALAERSNSPLADVQVALNRFAAQGWAASDAPTAVRTERNTSNTRAASNAPTTAHTTTRSQAKANVTRSNPTRLPLVLGAMALVAAALTVWFFARPSVPPISQPTSATPSVVAATATTAATTAIAAAPTVQPTPPPAIAPDTPIALVSTVAPTPNAAEAAGAVAQRAAAAAAAKEAATKAATKSATTAAANTDPRAPAAPLTAATPPPPAASATPAASPVVATPPASVAASPPAVASTPTAPAPVATAAPTPTAPSAAAGTPAKASTAVAAREGRLLERVEPVYPRNVQYENGTVRARVSVNAAGAVTGVEIISANPPRVFDRSVSTALAQWKYEATGEASSRLVEVSFQR